MQDDSSIIQVPKFVGPRKIRVTHPHQLPMEGIPLAWTTAAFEITPIISGHFQRMIVQEPVVVIDTGKSIQVVRLSDDVELKGNGRKIEIEWIDESTDSTE